jgi:hypothetical protein
MIRPTAKKPAGSADDVSPCHRANSGDGNRAVWQDQASGKVADAFALGKLDF